MSRINYNMQGIHYNRNLFILATLLCQVVNPIFAQQKKTLPPLSEADNGKLVYVADEKGNRIPDFSYCGYMASDIPIPQVPTKILVPLNPGDATLRIQSAIDYVASLP